MTIVYYPLYSGWDLPEVPHLFKQPSEALSFALARFKQDGLSNIWGRDTYPPFVKHVGQLIVPASELSRAAFASNSQIEKNYFAGVGMFKWEGMPTPPNHSYVRCLDSMFDQ